MEVRPVFVLLVLCRVCGMNEIQVELTVREDLGDTGDRFERSEIRLRVRYAIQHLSTQLPVGGRDRQVRPLVEFPSERVLPEMARRS